MCRQPWAHRAERLPTLQYMKVGPKRMAARTLEARSEAPACIVLLSVVTEKMCVPEGWELTGTVCPDGCGLTEERGSLSATWPFWAQHISKCCVGTS